jgi:tetratricopeptide (TPR) repeat protein
MRAGRGLRQAVVTLLLGVAIAGPASADDPYAAGLAAFEQEDWQEVLAHMTAALEARPRQENAHLLMGIAYGKLGAYPAALEAYGEALTLNPYNRGTLEYLGEAYLELDRPDDAKATLDRLAEACRRLAHAAVDPLTTCAEWQELSRAYEAYMARDPTASAE